MAVASSSSKGDLKLLGSDINILAYQAIHSSDEEDLQGFEEDDCLDDLSQLTLLETLIAPISKMSRSSSVQSLSQSSKSSSVASRCSSPVPSTQVSATTSPQTKVSKPLKAASPTSSRSKRGIDLANPIFRKALDLGWKRELVYRNTTDARNKRLADIYYYTPSGKKLRSNREVAEALIGSDLTLDNFTFHKEPLGISDPNKEIIREAKKVLNVVSSSPKQTSKPLEKVKVVTSPVVADSGSDKPTPTVSDSGSSEDDKPPSATCPSNKKNEKSSIVSPKDKPISRVFPRIKVTPTNSPRVSPSKPSRSANKTSPTSSLSSPNVFRAATTSKRAIFQRREHKSPSRGGDLEMGMLPPMWKDPQKNSNQSAGRTKHPISTTHHPPVSTSSLPGSTSGTRTVSNQSGSTQSKTTKKYEPCSVWCADGMGIVPSLQCRLCLCLYHPECVGLGTLTDVIHSYVCKNCQEEKKDGKTPSSTTSSSKLVDYSISNLPTSTSPPPLTPISTLAVSPMGSGSGGVVGTLSPPKLQRLPRPNDQAGKLYMVPRYVKVPCRDVKLGPPTTTKSTIVGSVTTWLPPSSTIQLTSTATKPSATTNAVSPVPGTANTPVPTNSMVVSDSVAGSGSPPTHTQFLARIAGKRYIMVPKHNVLSVSPAMAATPTSPTSKASSMGLSEAAPPGDKAPAALCNTSFARQYPVVQSQVILGSSNSAGDNNTTSFPVGNTGVPILPKPNTTAAYLPNPPGVLLLPVVPSTPVVPSADGSSQQQYVVVNGPSGGFLFSNMSSSQKSVTTEEDMSKKNAQVGTYIMMNLNAMYSALKNVFEYFKVVDLLQASQVCRMWHDLAESPSLWQTVRLKNSRVYDWKGCAEALCRHRTKALDLRKLLNFGNDMWGPFCDAIMNVSSLRQIILCRCPFWVVERMARTCPQLESITALSIMGENISLNVFNHLQLQELRLKSQSTFNLVSKLDVLKESVKLTHLSLTTLKGMGKADPNSLKTLVSLETLELGEVLDFPETFGVDCLSRLVKLQRLRLEKGDSNSTIMILNAVCDLPALSQLEMINFEVQQGFDDALLKCSNIRRLLLIPTYVTQSATTNHIVLSGILKMNESLQHFEWGVTHELLRVTELFVDQCNERKEDPNKMYAYGPSENPENGSIPVLRPVPGVVLEESDAESCVPSSASVDILKLTTLIKKLHEALPNTTVRILKIPFQATWRQSLSVVDKY